MRRSTANPLLCRRHNSLAVEPQPRCPLPPLRAQGFAVFEIDLVVACPLGDLAKQGRTVGTSPQIGGLGENVLAALAELPNDGIANPLDFELPVLAG